MNLDLGCGTRKRPNCIGIDKAKLQGVDIVHDLENGLPIRSNSVDKIYAYYTLEHIENIIFLFQEMYRVLKNNGTVELLVPYYNSINAIKDLTHKHFFCEDTFRYFSKDKWYGSDYGINTDFEVVSIEYHYSKLVPKWMPFKRYLRRHITNLVGAITVTLKARKDEK